MVVKKKPAKEEDNPGVSLDEAFGDDKDVEYAKPKPAKIKKKKEQDMDDLVDDALKVITKINSDGSAKDPPKIKGSKPIAKIKKGDKMKLDTIDVEVDTHYMLMDHGSTKEMAIEVFDKNDNDYQIRYFDDQVEGTLEVYQLQEIMYLRKPFRSVSW